MGFVKKRILSVTGLLAVSMIAGTVTINAQSQKKTKVAVNIPSAGIAVALDNYDIQDEAKKAELTSLMNQKVATPNQEEDKKDAADNTDKNKENETDKETEKKAEEEKAEQPKTVYDTMAMSQVEDYVNVRALPSTDADIVGKIYNNCAAKIVGVEGEWYKIESGNVTGYIYSKYFVTGEEAKAVAIQQGYVNATVTTETLNVRDGQGTDAKLLTQLPEGEVYDVIQYGDGWVYLNVDEDIQGWVSMDYVDIDVKYATALTLEEEQAKIAEEERKAAEAAEAERLAREAKEAEEAEQARRAAAAEQAAAAKRAERARQAEETQQTQTQTSRQSNYEEETQAPVQSEPTYDSSSSSAMRNAVVAYALQFVGNPYVYGGSSLTNGTDCSGFTMAVYQHFGISLPHQSGSQSGCGVQVSTDSLLPGDLLFYTSGGSGIGHVALYIGNGQVVHASTPATGIKVSSAFYRTPVSAVRLIQ